MNKLRKAYMIMVTVPFLFSCTSDKVDPVSGMEFVKVPSGCFQMGHDKHKVCINNEFYMGKYEVTQEQWLKLVGRNRSTYIGKNHPVETVNLEDIHEFIRRLNKKTGKKYRLPTEAEWEYACLSGGKNQMFCGGNTSSSIAWEANSKILEQHHGVGQKAPNDYGLFDMTGNVSEWTCSEYDYSYGGDEEACNDSGRIISIRGGSWKDEPSTIYATHRSYLKADYGLTNLGFRLVMEL